MAIGLFDLDDCEHGMVLPGLLFGAPDAGLFAQPSGKSTPLARSRRTSPAPLAPVPEQNPFGTCEFAADMPASCDSALSDVFFDEPAWFGDGAFCADSSDVLLSPTSAPLSGASHYLGELSFLGYADAAGSAAPDTDFVWWSEGDSPARFLAGSPRPAPADKRARDEELSLIPNGEAICAALAAAVPAIVMAERSLKRARPAAMAEPASFARTVSDGARYGYGFVPYYGAPQMHGCGAPQMHGCRAPQMYCGPVAPLPFSRTCSAAETVVMQAFSRSSSAAFSRTSSAAFSRTSSSASTTRRGENVKGNPQMQKTARDGQKHWHDKCKQLRAEAEEAGTSAAHAQFENQRHVCAARNLKCQKESLLIFLQMAAQQKLISPLACVPASDEAAGFVGWTGFRVEPGCGGQFRAGVERLFPETPKLNTLYHLFRRSGLVPQDWRRAWDGEIPFQWNPNRVS